MTTTHKTRSGYRVIGPNTADGRITTWYPATLAEAKTFAESIAKEMDAEYDILLYVGTVRQVPLEPRPVEWVEAASPQETASPKGES